MRPSEGSARDGPVVARLVVNPCGFLQPVLLAPAQPFALRVVTGRFSSRVTKTPLRLFPRRAFSTLSAEPCPASTTELRQRLAGAPCGASLPCLSGLGAWAGAILVLFSSFPTPLPCCTTLPPLTGSVGLADICTLYIEYMYLPSHRPRRALTPPRGYFLCTSARRSSYVCALLHIYVHTCILPLKAGPTAALGGLLGASAWATYVYCCTYIRVYLHTAA